MAPQRKKQSQTAAKNPKKPLPAENGAMTAWFSGPNVKPILIGAISGIALPLLAYFLYTGNINGPYWTALGYGSLLLFIGALPNAKLGFTAIFLFVQPLIILLENSEYGYTKVAFSLLAISVLLILWVADLFRKSPVKIQLTHLIWPGIFLLGVMLLSLINGKNLWADFQYIPLVLYFVFFYLFLANILENQSQIRYLLRTILMATFLASIYGLLQYFGVLPGAPGEVNGIGAIISTFGNKNYMAGFLAYLMLPGFVLYFKPATRWERWFGLAALTMLFVMLLAANSDAAWVAVILSLGVSVIGLIAGRELKNLAGEWRWGLLLFAVFAFATFLLVLASIIWLDHTSISLAKIGQLYTRFTLMGWLALILIGLVPLLSRLLAFFAPGPRRRWFLAGAAALLLLLLGLSLTPPGGRLVSQASQVISSRWDAVRSQDWLIGLEMFKASPLLGTGLGDYKREFLDYKGPFLASPAGAQYDFYIMRAAQAHNEYIQIMAELGLAGVAALLLLIGLIFWGALRALRHEQDSGKRWLLVCIFAGITAFMADSLFSFPLHLPANALALVFLLGVLNSRALVSPRVEVKIGRPAAVALSVAVVLIAGVTLNAMRSDWLADISFDRGRNIYQSGGDAKEAERLLQESITLDFAPGEAYYWLGMIHYQNGDLVKSKEYFERSLSVFTIESTYFYLGAIYQQLKDYDQALRYVDFLLKLDPEPSIKPDGLQLRAVIIYNQGHQQEGIQAMLDAGEAFPKNARIFFTLAEMYLEQADLAQKEGNSELSAQHVIKAKEALERSKRVVDDRLAQVNKILQPEEATDLTTNKYFSLRLERDSLRALQERINTYLRKIP